MAIDCIINSISKAEIFDGFRNIPVEKFDNMIIVSYLF